MPITLDGTLGITTPALTVTGAISYTGTLTGGTGVVNLGSGQFYKDATGLIGISNASPNAKLHIGGVSASSAQAIFTNGVDDPNFQLWAVNGVAGASGTVQASLGLAYSGVGFGSKMNFIRGGGTTDGTIAFETAGTERMRIDSAGRVGIGEPSIGAKLHVNGSITSATTLGYLVLENASSANQIQSATANFAAWKDLRISGNNLIFARVGDVEAMRVTDNGRLAVASTGSGRSATIITDNIGGISSFGISVKDASGTTGGIEFLNTSGTQVGAIYINALTTTYATTSDYRLKTVVATIADAGKRIDSIEPIEYDWKTGGRTRGFLAHKFAEVYPNSVSGEKDAVDAEGKPVYQSMQASTPEVMADLIAEIQSLRKRVAQLESK